MPCTLLLIAEDDDSHATLIRYALAEDVTDVEVQLVSRGADLLEQIGTRPWDCVLMDFYLPDVEAPELLRLVRASSYRGPVLIMSSSMRQGVAIDSLRGGEADFLPKSEAFVPGQLWGRIQALIRRHQRVQDERRRVQRRARRLTHLALCDELTGLPNRRQAVRLLNPRRRELDRRGTSAVAMLDIDHFKQVNDRHGHATGDAVLRAVADVLRAALGPEDFAARWGGEEFLIILPHRHEAAAVTWAEHLRHAISCLRVPTGPQQVSVTASIGVSASGSVPLGEHTISQADDALYFAKRWGRNRVCTWEMVLAEKLRVPLGGSGHASRDQALQRWLERGTTLQALVRDARAASSPPGPAAAAPAPVSCEEG